MLELARRNSCFIVSSELDVSEEIRVSEPKFLFNVCLMTKIQTNLYSNSARNL
jgi:hypothetical protein